MRFLNRLISCLVILCVFHANCYANAEEPAQSKDNTKIVTIFGYPFHTYSNFGQNNYFEFDASGSHTQLTINQMKSDVTARAFMTDRLSLFQSVFDNV